MLSRLKDWLCSLWERHLLKPVDSCRENKQIEQTLEIGGAIDVTDSTLVCATPSTVFSC